MDIKNVMLALNHRPIAVYPVYIDMTGSHTAAVLLSQLMYWWSACGGRKFYKTDQELMQETRMTFGYFRTAKAAIKELPWMLITVQGVPAKTWYDIDAEKLAIALSEINKPTIAKQTEPVLLNSQNYDCQINTTITENTTENTYKDISLLNSKEEFSEAVKEFAKKEPDPEVLVVESKPEKKPNNIYALYEAFSKFMEEHTGLAMAVNDKGHYIMSGKSAAAIKQWTQWMFGIGGKPETLEQDWIDFLEGAWQVSRSDKWLRNNFDLPIIVSKRVIIRDRIVRELTGKNVDFSNIKL